MPDVDGKEWLIEHQYVSPNQQGWILYDVSITDPIFKWCTEQNRLDPEFQWTYKNGKKAPLELQVVATDMGLEERYSIKTTILGNYFYFQREQDLMLFKLAWA